MKQHLQQMEGRTNARLDELRTYVERMETTLLTEFHKWASPAEMRARSHSAALRAMDIEIEALPERVEKLEKPGQQH